jgi:hypothetical protein
MSQIDTMMPSSSPYSERQRRSQPRQQRRRTKQVSSSVGSGSMFFVGLEQKDSHGKSATTDTVPSLIRSDDDDNNYKTNDEKTRMTTTTNDTMTLKEMAVQLRRAKRRLFLSAVTQDTPPLSSESFRILLLTQLSLQASSSSSFSSSSSTSTDSTISSRTSTEETAGVGQSMTD